ncbi:FKBP-type peptidyl-prolyl cis-trans isomerase [Pseudonocardiaceae bacterium YIM PH 21723]|nr:FKBP-type peptidyl-prolyl cis-trans isomerase [Pseudonocardiaceae bacterium YIM PH 21723]
MLNVTRPALAVVAAIAAAAFTLTGCSNSEKASTKIDTPGATTTAATVAAPKGKTCVIDDFKVAGEIGKKPTVTVPQDCDPPKELLSKDLVPGTGPEIKTGDKVAVDYSLVLFSNSKNLDNSYDRGQPFALTVGAGRVIKGWEQGLVGLKQGGRRLLVIPSDLGYGPDGSPPEIKGGETLVFVVDGTKAG